MGDEFFAVYLQLAGCEPVYEFVGVLHDGSAQLRADRVFYGDGAGLMVIDEGLTGRFNIMTK